MNESGSEEMLVDQHSDYSQRPQGAGTTHVASDFQVAASEYVAKGQG